MSKKKLLEVILLVLSVLLTTVQSLDGKEETDPTDFYDGIE